MDIIEISSNGSVKKTTIPLEPSSLKIKRNDLKKGDEVVLKGGQKAIIANNKRGTVRMMNIQQIYRPDTYLLEDEYVHNISHVTKHLGKDGFWTIEYSEKQRKQNATIKAFMDNL